MPPNSHPIFDYIFDLTIPGVKLELSRIQDFFRVIGEPWQDYKVVHVAGTNGKGSTAAAIAALLQALGFRTGLNTSPHLVLPNERIRVNGQMVPDDFIIHQVEEWKPLVDRFQLTFFELLTALAMKYFEEQEVDYAVLETGLGGRLDATNVVTPEIAVITAIDLDHRRILGDSLEKIAGEKAGIIKVGRPVLLGPNQDSVREVIRNKAEELNAPCHEVADICQIEDSRISGLRQVISGRLGDREFQLSSAMLGRHQTDNLATALACLEILGLQADDAVLQKGMDLIHWPARMEVLQSDPLVLYDVAHNPGGVRSLLETLHDLGYAEAMLLGGLNEKKDIQTILGILDEWEGARGFFAFEGHFGCRHASLLEAGVDPELAFQDLQTGLDWARDQLKAVNNPCLCVFGSHYFAAELYDAFNILPR